MADTLLGKDFTPPDITAKVTGKAKYAEDFRADGMVFCKLLLSPFPHARVTRIDARAALDTPGVVGILTADDVPAQTEPLEQILSNEPVFVGSPILAVAAETEELAVEALLKIDIAYDPLPFVTDPLAALKPGGPSARSDGNATLRGYGLAAELMEHRWTDEDFARAGEGVLPRGAPMKSWHIGDIDAGFATAALVLEENFVVGSNSHHSMEPRSAMAYWLNGKCYLHGSSQSQTYMMPGLAEYLDIPVEDIVYIAEYCGGGFGSKGTAYPVMVIPAYLSKKIGRPVMMRVTRDEEYYFGGARAGFQGNVKMGFAPDGRITAIDINLVKDSGPHAGFPDLEGAGAAISLVYQPQSMRFSGVSPNTNTPPRMAQRGPGQNQMAVAIEPLMDKAARELGIDRVEIRKINAADNNSTVGPKREPLTSAYQRNALELGAEQFEWQRRMKTSGQRNGSRVRAIGCGQAFHPAGFTGFDGLVRITPDGLLHIHTGVGNLGTYSYSSTARAAADVLQYEWSRCVIERGDSRKALPFNMAQVGSNTSFTMTRTNVAAARDALQKIREIAALEFGGDAAEYEIAEERVFRRSAPGESLSYASVAERAIELGGKFAGADVGDELNPVTRGAAGMIAGTGLVGIARDDMPREGITPAFAAGFAEIELDLETGKFRLLDYLGVADCGTVLHPQGLATQIKGGAVMGIGMATLEHMVYDPSNGLPANVGLYQAKPPSYLDVPSRMQTSAVNIPDPQNPVGAKGVGEPLMGCAGAAILCAISEALGGHLFNRTPVHPDMIVNAAANKPQSHRPLQVHTQ